MLAADLEEMRNEMGKLLEKTNTLILEKRKKESWSGWFQLMYMKVGSIDLLWFDWYFIGEGKAERWG